MKNRAETWAVKKAQKKKLDVVEIGMMDEWSHKAEQIRNKINLEGQQKWEEYQRKCRTGVLKHLAQTRNEKQERFVGKIVMVMNELWKEGKEDQSTVLR